MSVTGTQPWTSPLTIDARVCTTSSGRAVVSVVRDDLLYGGSKTRFLPFLIGDAQEIVFGGPFCGGAPVALAAVGRVLGRRVTLFYAKRGELHPRQRWAQEQGATIVQIPYGYMSNVQSKAKAYAEKAGALFLPLGFDVPAAEEPFIEVMRGLRDGGFDEVWCASGSGMLARCLGRALPEAQIQAVAVGLASRWKKQTMPANVAVLEAAYDFGQACRLKQPAPFPICPNYEAKAWELLLEKARGRVLFWNVIGA